jgi:hypothetical protein
LQKRQDFLGHSAERLIAALQFAAYDDKRSWKPTRAGLRFVQQRRAMLAFELAWHRQAEVASLPSLLLRVHPMAVRLCVLLGSFERRVAHEISNFESGDAGRRWLGLSGVGGALGLGQHRGPMGPPNRSSE